MTRYSNAPNYEPMVGDGRTQKIEFNINCETKGVEK